MEIIATHDSADFDAFASLFAAQKLYPSAIPVLTVNVGSEVRSFLALHKDRFVTLPVREVDLEKVSRFVVVDVRRKSRLGAYVPLCERAFARDPSLLVHVYDHHAAADDDLPATTAVVERTGSATTLLVERIAAAEIVIDPVEATLFALGIHVDTGSLSYAGTTARDAAALGFLLSRGVRLAVLNRYLHGPHLPRHRALLRALLGRAETIRIAGEDVALCDATFTKTQDGLDIVASDILELEGHRALFVWAALRKGRVHVVGRSLEGGIDAAAVLSRLGGGGHATAATALVSGQTSDEVRESLLAALAAEPSRSRTVRDIMTSPAFFVPSSTLLGALRDSLATWHYTGIPIVDDSKLVGIVSATDIRNLGGTSLRHPVSSRMRREVITIGPDEPLESALRLMSEKDIGRLPVMRDGQLIGILTRSDARRALYGVP